MANQGPGLAQQGEVKPLVGLIRRHRWLPAVAWAAAMLCVSSVPKVAEATELFRGCDKVLHFIEYSVLGGALRYWTARHGKLVAGGGIAFGALDELHQMWIPNRIASFWDLTADAAGIVFGYVISKYFIRREAA
jgi:VanZ family protein